MVALRGCEAAGEGFRARGESMLERAEAKWQVLRSSDLRGPVGGV